MNLWHLLTMPFRRGPRRPLATRRPEPRTRRRPELGMEATDLALVEKINRRNDALERVTNASFAERRAGFFTAHAATDIDPMPEDETYAAQYHRAFNKKGS